MPARRAPDIDAGIDRLDEALRRVGARPLSPAPESDALDRIAGAIDPSSLPSDLVRLWQRIDLRVDRFVVSAWRMPALCDPRAALEAYRVALESGHPFLYGPPLLFPLAVDKETRWSVELTGESGPGGTVLSHDDAIRVEYPGVADLLDAFAEVIETGGFERGAEGRIVLTDVAERRARAARLHAAAPDITNDPSGWPDRWLRSAGLELDDRAPLGATHSIAELRRAGAEGIVEGRIAGTVAGLRFVGAGYHVLVDDGASTLDVWCPMGTTRWGLAHGCRYEFAVRYAALGEDDQPAPARATAVRPV